jgi:hypothetical protein
LNDRHTHGSYQSTPNQVLRHIGAYRGKSGHTWTRYRGKRDLLQRQKRPSIEAKETYYRGKRRPTTEAKETYYRGKRDLV